MITNICEREYKMKEEEYKQKWKTSFALGEKVFRNAVQRQMQSDFKERIKTETLYLIPTYIKKGKMDLSESRQGIYKIIPPENENKNHPVKEIKCKPMESRLSPMDLMLANNPDQFASYIFTEHGIAVYDPGYRELREDEKELLKHWEENEFTEDHEQQVKNAVYDGLTTSTYLKQSLEAGDKEYLFGTSPKFGEVLDVKKYRLGDPKCVLSKDVPGELKEEYLIVTEKELQLQKKEQEVSWCGNIGGGSMRDTQDYELIGKYLAKHLNLAAAMSTTFQPGERNYLNFKSPEDELRFEQEDENLKDDYGFVYASNGYTNMKYLENSKFNRLYNIIDGVLRNAGEAHNSARCSQLTSVVYQTWTSVRH